MAPRITIPSTPEGLRELMDNADRLKEIFRDPDSIKEFSAKYAENFGKRSPDSDAELNEKIQAGVASFLRQNGNGRKSPVAISAGLSNGRPVLTADGTSLVSHGRGAVYNKTAVGAALERAYPEDGDRFGSIGEYCQAIRAEAKPGTLHRNRAELLHKLDVVRQFQNSFGSEDPGAGGFLIPEIMRSELLQLALEQSIVRSRATVIPMSTLSVPIPTVDDTSHVSSVLGGIQFYWAEEASSITESQATFGQINLTAKKLAGFFKVPNQLLDDATAFSAFFDTRVPDGLAWFEDVSFMNETGVGTPRGFINCDAAVIVTTEPGQSTKTIVWENVLNMYMSMLPTSHGNAVWICSHDSIRQLMTMALSVGTGGGPVMIGGLQQPGSVAPPMTILGRPVVFTEKVGPLGTTGDINYVDLSYYLVGDRQAVEVMASEHAFFQNDQTAYRLIERVDGQPWLQSALTAHNNSSTKLSPFVQLASR